MHGVHATANAAPATSGPPLPARLISASGRHSLLSIGMNGVSTKKTPSRTIIAPAILSSVPLELCSVDPIPVAVMPSATNTTVNDRQKTIAGSRILRQAALARLHVGDRQARDRREIAGHERQHARRDEGHEADRERRDHGGVDAAGQRLSSASRRWASSALSSGGSSVSIGSSPALGASA